MRSGARRLARSLLALASLGLPPAGAGAPPRPVAIGASLAVEDGRTRLSLALSRPVVASAFALESPDRLVLELGDVNLQVPPEEGRRRTGLVAGFRGGAAGPGRARLVIDLAAPATVTRLEIGEGRARGAASLVLELAPADRDAFRRATADRAASADEPATTGSLRPAEAVDRRPLVALDAGHGGADPGAVAANGAAEKDVVLGFAQALRARLVAGGAVRVIMTRDGDHFVPLDERVRRARAAGAALFISIHADSIATPTVRGATIYTGADRATDAESAQLADRENAADGLGPASAAAAEPGVQDILHDLTHRETRGFSHRFAGYLHGGLTPVTRFTAQPHREAGFRVLRAPDMPSVLLELGYMSNSRDADLMTTDGWRERTSAAMASAVERFLRVGGPPRAAMSP